MSERLFRFLFVLLYALAATLYHYPDAAIEYIFLVVGCVTAYVIAVNLPPFIETKLHEMEGLL